MIKKPKKKRTQTKKYWRNKADKMQQDICRELWSESGCLVCGGEYSCAHHFVKKSQSTILRYNIKNLIPICAKCHNKHHSYGDSTVHANITIIKGQDWLIELMAIKRSGIGMNADYTWYRDKYEKLKLLKPYRI